MKLYYLFCLLRCGLGTSASYCHYFFFVASLPELETSLHVTFFNCISLLSHTNPSVTGILHCFSYPFQQQSRDLTTNDSFTIDSLAILSLVLQATKALKLSMHMLAVMFELNPFCLFSLFYLVADSSVIKKKIYGNTILVSRNRPMKRLKVQVGIQICEDC